MRGPRVVFAAMRAHEDAELHVTGCKLFAEFAELELTWQTLIGASTDNINFFTEALRYSVAGKHLRATRHLCKLLASLSIGPGFINSLVRMHEIPTVLVGVMRLVLANIDTETSFAAISNYKAMWYVTAVLWRLFQNNQEELLIRRLLDVPGSLVTILKLLQYTHDLSISPPSALFQRGKKRISHKTCSLLQERLLFCLRNLAFLHNFAENALEAGALPVVLNIIVETENQAVRIAACRTLGNITADDNGTRRLFANARGVGKFAVLLRATPVSERAFLWAAYPILVELAEFPSYRTDMVEAGFLEIAMTHTQAFQAINQNALCSERLYNSLQQDNGT